MFDPLLLFSYVPTLFEKFLIFSLQKRRSKCLLWKWKEVEFSMRSGEKAAPWYLFTGHGPPMNGGDGRYQSWRVTTM
jgi:hypothetical protein